MVAIVVAVVVAVVVVVVLAVVVMFAVRQERTLCSAHHCLRVGFTKRVEPK